VTLWRKPSVGRVYPIERPTTDDEFTSPTLGLQWQWNHNPLNDRWSLQERPGFLRLKASPAESFATARNTLTQKLWDDAGVVETKIDLGGMAVGQRAGLAFMYGMKFGWIGATQDGNGRKLEWNGGKGPRLAGNILWLRETYQADQAHFAYSLDGKAFTDAGITFQLGYANWKGSRPALYSFGPNGGYVDVDYFHYTYGATVAEAMAPAARP
jgi:beta-xylosidase